ncbi:pyrroline-5-carboxylate reductase [Fundidesulfovibrio butyratiphilus]
MNATISFIGTGNMGQALMRSLVDMPVPGVTLAAYDVDQAKLNDFCAATGVKAAASLSEAVKTGDYVVLCVKPQQLGAVRRELGAALTPAKCLVSIVAGVTAQALRDLAGGVCPVVRVMPNTPALVSAGVMALCLEDPDLTDEQKRFVEAMLSRAGQVQELPEKDFDAFTAVVGSGPAYVFYFMEAVVEAAVAQGLQRAQATQMVTALFAGSVKLAEQSPLHLSQLREMVTSPAGTTIAALMHMDRQAVRGAIVDAVGLSAKRSKELGK